MRGPHANPAEIPVLKKLLVAFLLGLGLAPSFARTACLTECAPRLGIVSAFGAEADLLVAQTRSARTWLIDGNRFTTGTLRGVPVVIVLSGVSMVNSAMVTQLMIDHFHVQRLVMSGIAGGVDPTHHVGDVIIPDRWAMPLEVFWNRDATPPSPCGHDADVSCLGLKLATGADGRPLPPFEDLFMRETHVRSAASGPAGEFRFDYPVDAAMLAVARTLRPALARCGPKAYKSPGAEPDPALCVKTAPQVVVGGLGVSGGAFLANAAYRAYLFEQLRAQTFEMETAALAHVARANGIPYIAFRSLSDLAGAQDFDADAVALFASGLAETNEAAVTLAFLEAWGRRK